MKTLKNYLIIGAFAVSFLFNGLNNSIYGQECRETFTNPPKIKEKKIKEIRNNQIKQKNFNFLEKMFLMKMYLKKEVSDSTFLKLKKFANIKNEKGKRNYTLKELSFFTNLDNYFYRPDRYEYLKLINKEYHGKNIFSLDDIFMISQWDYDADEKRSPKNILKLIDYKDEEGNFIFNSNKILTYIGRGVNLRNLVEAIDSSKNKSPEEITREFYTEAIKKGLKRNELDELLNFNDTKKPNALITIPSSDYNRAFSALWEGGPGTIWHDQNFILKNLRDYYDIKLIIVETEQEIYSAIEEMPNIDFLVISGHGSQNTLSLGSADRRIYTRGRSEKYAIDTSDTEFKKYLEMLNDSATIFLHACNTAEESFFNKKNLAKFISKIAKDKRVAAYKTPAVEACAKKYYPFEFADPPERFDGQYNQGVYYINGKQIKQ